MNDQERPFILTVLLAIAGVAIPAASRAAPPRIPTSAQCRRLAARVAAAISADDPRGVDACFDRRRFAARSLAGAAEDAPWTGAFRRRALEKFSFGSLIAGTIEKRGHCGAPRVHDVDGQRRLLFPIVAADDSLVYLDALVELDQEGRPQIVDAWNLRSTQWLSVETLRRFVTGRAGRDAELRRSLTGPAKRMSEMHAAIRPCRELAREGKIEKAL